MDLSEIFEKHSDEFLKFERVENKLSNRADLHAFIMLDRLQPQTIHDMISSAEHDKIYLEPDPESLNLTEVQVIELLRCGVRYDYGTNSLHMFV